MFLLDLLARKTRVVTSLFLWSVLVESDTCWWDQGGGSQCRQEHDPELGVSEMGTQHMVRRL